MTCRLSFCCLLFLAIVGQALARLEDPKLQDLALAKMEGYTNEETARQRGCSVRTVERRLHLIRKKWQRELLE